MVNVPPLLCSTPPPIDFGEDDDDSGLQSTLNLDDNDEYSDFGLVTQTHEAELNTKEPPLPRLTPQPELELPISDYSALPPPAHKSTAEDAKQTVEAFNYQVTTSPSPVHHHTDEDEAEEEEEEPNTNDNVPSLKLDSLSLYSSESISACSTLSPVADEVAATVDVDSVEPPVTQQAATKAHVLCHQVTLEDVSDDSDEECSPKKPKEMFISEGADDFFAIEIVEQSAVDRLAKADQEETATAPLASSIEKCDSMQHEDEDVNFAAFPDLPPPDNFVAAQASDNDEDDDFGDFADFSVAPPAEPVLQQPAAEESPDDGFDDFQDFAAVSNETEDVKEIEVEAEDGEDDDFGDFAAPSFLPAPPPPAATQLSINERVKPVLELMFPLSTLDADAAGLASKTPKPLASSQAVHFDAIERAHALDYQWASSEMRHSLVRSLAIDSRNILFGDKWNSSMPRFAANLSCDPLKPLKPLGQDQSQQQQPLAAAASLVWPSQSSSSQTLEGLDATAAQTSAAETQPGEAHGQRSDEDDDDDGENGSQHAADFAAASAATIDDVQTDFDDDAAASDAAAASSEFAVAATAASLSIALPANGDGQRFDGCEQQLQQHIDLRSVAVVGEDELVVSSSSNIIGTSATTSYAMPLKETHIYTPSKSDTAVAKTTTLPPVDFDFEMAAAGIIIDETVVKKEYRDVEYKPPQSFGLDKPIGGFEPVPAVKSRCEDDDFSDFQSMPATHLKATAMAQQQPPRNGTPTFGEHMILSPAILLPQAIPLAKSSIEWGESAMASINAEELARIEELFPQQQARKTPTISATVAQQQEDDDWSDFVSVPHSQNINNNNVAKQQPLSTPQRKSNAIQSTAAKEDDWSDFVSSTLPLPPPPPAARSAPAPQFNSGAWQSANFYNNPLSLYKQQTTPTHSNLVHKYQHSYNNNNNNNNNNQQQKAATPQQIHIMHDFSTAPLSGAAAPHAATYQQQHHQHHQQQQQLQQRLQQRQQFQIGNAKVAPRISLIPDLSFVAPALPNNAGAFMSSMPLAKPSFSAKK